MLSPEQRADAEKWLQSEKFDLHPTSHGWRCISTALDAIANEFALAEQVRMLRGALEAEESARGEQMPDVTASQRLSMIRLARIKRSAALALTLTEAARQAAENAEKAGLLEWWFTESNEAARNRIRDKRNESGDQWPEYQWTAEQWIAEVRTAKQADRG